MVYLIPQRIFFLVFLGFSLIKVINFFIQTRCVARALQREGMGDLSPPFTQKFFNLLGFLRKKPENPPLKFFHTKILKISFWKNFWLRR